MRPALTKIVLLAVGVLLGACGRFEPDATEPVAGGGSIVVGLPEIGSLDPAHATSPSALALLRTSCDGLTGLDHANGLPRGALANDWVFSEGGGKLTVDFRSGLEFQDGTAVTAVAVREALSRVARPSTTSPWASLVSRVEGFGEVQSGAATHLSGVRALESTIEITFSEPFSGFLNVLAHPALIPVSLESLRQAPEGADLPVCAGPYRIERGAEEKDLRLGKVTGSGTVNEAFVNDGMGSADLILVRSFDSGEDAYGAYLAGQVDIAPVPVSRVGEARSNQGLRSEAIPQTTFLGFDQSHPATQDPRLRQAISLSVDRLAIIDAAYGDQREPSIGWLPSEFGEGGDRSCASYVRRIADPDRARQLYGEVRGESSPLELALYYDVRTTGRPVAEALELQIEQVLGIEVAPTALEGQDVLTHYRTKPQAPSAWIMEIGIDLGLPDEFLGTQFDAAEGDNPLSLQDPVFEQLIDDARKATSASEIQRRYSLAEAELCRLMPGVPLWTGVSSWMFSPERVAVESELYLDSLGSPLLRHSFGANG